MTARVQIKKSGHGAIYDVIADFMIIATGYMLLVYKRDLSLLIIPFLLVSFISFSIYSIIKKRLIKNTIGQFTGVVCFTGILFIFFLRIFFTRLLSFLICCITIIVSLYLLLSTAENLILILGHYLNKNASRKE